MLKVVNLSAGYDKLAVIKGVSINVKANEVVALIGNNGAGKSTLMKAVCGLLRPMGGRVLLDGHDIAGRSPEKTARMGLALVPESRALFWDMSVCENLRVGASGHRLTRSEIACRFDTVYSLFPMLADKRNSQAGELSGGQQQMLALARAMMSSPRILMMDEPSTGLAPMMVDELFEKVALLKKEGMTILLAEQNIHKALDGADRGYVVENGRIVLEDTGQALKCSERVVKAYLGV